MRVMFRRKFFGPDHNRYPPKVWIDVPNSWAGRLPPGVKVKEEKAPEPVIDEEALEKGLAAEAASDKKDAETKDEKKDEKKPSRPMKKVKAESSISISRGAVVEL